MNYDRIIIELLDRVSKLEQEVTLLKNQKTSHTEEPEINIVPDYYDSGVRGETYTDRACAVIERAIVKAKEAGKEYVDIVSNDLQHAIGLKNRIPLCCNAMRKVAEKYRTEVIRDTPSHNSSTYTIRYYF